NRPRRAKLAPGDWPFGIGPDAAERFRWTFVAYFCRLIVGPALGRAKRDASNDWRWPSFLRSRANSERMGPDPRGHTRFLQSWVDGAGAHDLRVVGVEAA